ncbi:MAG: chromosomal replication initiator protein DnaA, partial [Terriglobus roseus]|nr:chromosomal replication initiator protein DnaA [Terriglobus roseus]
MSFAPLPAATVNDWMRILGALEMRVNRQNFQTWLKPTRFSHANGRTLFVRIPSAQFEQMLDRYHDLVHEAIDNMGLEVDDIRYVTAETDPSNPQPREIKTREDGGFAPASSHSPNAPQPPASSGFHGTSHASHGGLSPNRPSAPQAPTTEQSRFDWNSAAQLNSKYLFDNFVIGSGNQ